MDKTKSKQKSAINTVFVSAFIEATTNVITTMAAIEVKPQAPTIKKNPKPLGDIASVMQMSSPSVKGQLVLSFTTQSILAITSKILGEEFTEIDNDVTDMLGEITNIATGGAKAILEKDGFDFDMARPVVELKAGYDNLDIPSKTQIVIPYKSDYGPIYIEMGFEHIINEELMSASAAK